MAGHDALSDFLAGLCGLLAVSAGGRNGLMICLGGREAEENPCNEC